MAVMASYGNRPMSAWRVRLLRCPIGPRRVLGVGALAALGFQLRVGLLEGVGDDQAEDDMLVLGCVHAAPQGVGQRHRSDL